MALFLEFLIQQWTLTLALLVAIVMFFYHESRKSGPSLSPQMAINMINQQNGVVLDIRDNKEFQQGHIVSALNIPASKLESRMAELEGHREQPIILVCKMGQHSGAVGKQLRQQGFGQVYRLSGGMSEWAHLQLPLVS
jgi:rhodanese-related sulfurtransferase